MLNERETVLHSWCVQRDWDAPTVVGGGGAWFEDEQGKRYLDMSSLSECCNLGHQHPRVVEAIKQQADRLCFVTAAWGAEPRRLLAERLLDLSGFDGGRVFFTLGGADANEHAVKLARLATGLPHGTIVTRERSYHGASYAAMALSGDARVKDEVDPAAFNVVRAEPPYAYRCPFGSVEATESGVSAAAEVARLIDEQGAERVAAILVEPNAGTNGIVPPDSYWPALRRVTRERSVLLIADEVMSGFGRCGEWFAWQRHGAAARPDLMSLAKGLTGAHLPLGAVVVSADVARALDGKMLNSGLTYCGHPLCCAAGLAAIGAYEEGGLIERSRRLGEHMFRRLRDMQERVSVIGDVRGGHGLFAVVELVRDRSTKEPLAPWPETHPLLGDLVREGLAAGTSFAVRGNLVILAPPLVIGHQELDDALSLLERLLWKVDQTWASS
ncbi:MAG TPA: aminotransferase class III-fold pyridoxal phosphate-dependent enzyme [Allosphingosinicella sp.]|nr:aminotransferase class III-fold pyridoxal phosphate-dependent enzyme [Allosphingosinicella sp.]